jgi:shikimate kinase
VFAEAGEAHFRAVEARVVDAVAAESRQVISVGGGAVLRAENRPRLKGAGCCIWLTAAVETLAARIAADPGSAAQRPALSGGDVLAEIRALLEERTPLYAALADHVVSTDDRSLDAVADEVMALLPEDLRAGGG